MLDILIERFRQKKRTVVYPASAPVLPPRFRGRPFLDAERCSGLTGRDWAASLANCPTGALTLDFDGPALDMGLCTFCGNCALHCPRGAIIFTTDWRLASTERDALIIRPASCERIKVSAEIDAIRQSFPLPDDRAFVLPDLPLQVYEKAEGTFARSFRLRQVTAAGCGACEADLNVLATVVFDIARFGMDFVASPRHADGLVLTGPVPKNMREALIKCHAAMPAPKPVIAVGACAISGGLFRPDGKGENIQNALGGLPHVPVDLFIPGCPPHPYTSLDALLRFVGRVGFSPVGADS